VAAIDRTRCTRDPRRGNPTGSRGSGAQVGGARKRLVAHLIDRRRQAASKADLPLARVESERPIAEAAVVQFQKPSDSNQSPTSGRPDLPTRKSASASEPPIERIQAPSPPTSEASNAKSSSTRPFRDAFMYAVCVDKKLAKGCGWSSGSAATGQQRR
jgi:hypothetical protein